VRLGAVSNYHNFYSIMADWAGRGLGHCLGLWTVLEHKGQTKGEKGKVQNRGADVDFSQNYWRFTVSY